jgi:hypothetical protein
VEFVIKRQWKTFFYEYFGFTLLGIIPPMINIHLSIVWSDYYEACPESKDTKLVQMAKYLGG